MPKPEYVELETIKDPGGLNCMVVITYCDKPSGYREFSYCFFKTFRRGEGGPEERTSRLNKRHLEAARVLLDITEERLAYWRERLHRDRRERVHRDRRSVT